VKNFETIIKKLPYSEPFLFVDTLHSLNENGVEGSYTFPEDAWYYAGHFKDNPVTPGVILTEVMAQIGVVCLGIFLMHDQHTEDVQIAMTSAQVDFYLPVFPGETVTVTSTKEYFRFHKLKCRIEMHNSRGELVCRGAIAGMIKSKPYA
jgi:3-hydroxyacyl-[acyl-carrier-protein] dehydratase